MLYILDRFLLTVSQTNTSNFFGLPPATAWLLPVVLLPMLCLTMGLSWLLASLGVYLRDVSQVILLVTTALLFLSPIFYLSLIHI